MENNIESIKFQIDQLRKDKIIYAIEAVAINTLCLLIMIVSFLFEFPTLQSLIIVISLFIATGYTTYMGIGNFSRLKKIKELESQLPK